MTVARGGKPLQVRDVADAAAAVRQAGGRLTAARRAVIEALFAAEGPTSAEQIAAGLGGRVPRTETTSVYRNLEWLEELGIVRHVHLGHGAGLYALAGDREREYLVCERCARLTTVDAADLDRARREIERIAGYAARFSHFPIHGLCPDCAAKTS
jgi:Fur family transcriptional regulator, ferric uptake regulator